MEMEEIHGFVDCLLNIHCWPLDQSSTQTCLFWNKLCQQCTILKCSVTFNVVRQIGWHFSIKTVSTLVHKSPVCLLLCRGKVLRAKKAQHVNTVCPQLQTPSSNMPLKARSEKLNALWQNGFPWPSRRTQAKRRLSSITLLDFAADRTFSFGVTIRLWRNLGLTDVNGILPTWLNCADAKVWWKSNYLCR